MSKVQENAEVELLGRALRESEAQLRHAARTARLGYWHFDYDAFISRIHPAGTTAGDEGIVVRGLKDVARPPVQRSPHHQPENRR